MYGIYDDVPQPLEQFTVPTGLRPTGVYPSYNSSLSIHYDVTPLPRTENDELRIKEAIRNYQHQHIVDETKSK